MAEVAERYKKALVTVNMGLRNEDDIKKNGLYRFDINHKNDLIEHIKSLFEIKRNLLVLKVKKFGFRSEHINITSEEELLKFIENLDEVYGTDNEIWVVSSSVIKCWRCRIYLTTAIGQTDRIEMVYSEDDHIIDHLQDSLENRPPYVLYKKNIFEPLSVCETNCSDKELNQTKEILEDIFKKYNIQFKHIKEDLEILNIKEISIDCRINDGYDFHDFDVSYGDVKKVIDFYVSN